MSKSNENPTQQEGSEPEGETQERSFTQAEVDRIIADRLKREDVKGLKAKAAQFDELSEQQKTAEQRAAEKQQAAEQQAAEARAEAIRYRVATRNGISEQDAELFLTGQDEDTIAAQAKRLLERDAERKGKGNRVPNEGRTPTRSGQDDPMREYVSELFNRANTEQE